MKAWRTLSLFSNVLAPGHNDRALTSRDSRATRRLARYVTAGVSSQTLQRVSSWLHRFWGFLQRKAWRLGKCSPSPGMVTCNTLALEFLTLVADWNKGRTTVPAAARAINFMRKFNSAAPLSDDPRMTMLKRAVMRANPSNPRGALPIHAMMVAAVATAWGSSSSCWWRRMVAFIMLAAFQTLLRGAGILVVPNHSITWVAGSTEFLNPSVPPRNYTGVLLLVPKRKTKQEAPSWIPLKRGLATEILRRHALWRGRGPATNPFLFPSRKLRVSGNTRRWVPHPTNRMSQSSLCFLLRQALREVCGISHRDADRFTVHSLRVGGINFYRHLGVSTSMRAEIASHRSLQTSRRYLRLLPQEQLDELDNMVGV